MGDVYARWLLWALRTKVILGFEGEDKDPIIPSQGLRRYRTLRYRVIASPAYLPIAQRQLLAELARDLSGIR